MSTSEVVALNAAGQALSSDPAWAARGITDEQVDKLRVGVSRAKAANTRRTYDSHWNAWSRWALAHEFSPLPADPAHVALYFHDLADGVGRSGPVATSTLNGHLSAIRAKHKKARAADPYADPDLIDTVEALRRELGTRPKKAPALPLTSLLAACASLYARNEDNAALRNRILLVLGFGTGARRSELVALRVRDVDIKSNGVEVFIAKRKQDQTGEGHTVGVTRGHGPNDAVFALEQWIERASLQAHDPLFVRLERSGVPRRSADGRPMPLDGAVVTTVLRDALRMAGLPDVAKAMTSHSLRAGMITAAREAGMSIEQIIESTGQSPETARGYVRSLRIIERSASNAWEW